MKKQILLGSLLFSVISGFSQNPKSKPKSIGLLDTRILAESKFGSNQTQTYKVKENLAPVSAPDQKKYDNAKISSGANTWNIFTASMNIYGSSISHCKPLQWNDELNAVTFIHRKSPTYSVNPAPTVQDATNGAIVAMISRDCGATWDSTAIYANDVHWGRFPGGAIYNPTGNTEISNAYIVGAGPTTGAGNVTWIGNWYASKQLGAANYDNAPSTAVGAQQVAVTAGPYAPNLGRHDFSAYSFSATDDGKMRVLAGITDNSLATPSDSSIMLVTGTFNSTSNTFDWAGKVFPLPVTKASDGSFNFLSRPMMAWNEAGTVGYVVVMGSRIGKTGPNVGFQPIVYKTTNSGGTWSEENGIDFTTNAFADVRRPIVTVNTDTTLEVPNFFWGEGIDCTVDENNKLHIFTTVLGHASNHVDSLNFISQFTTERFLWQHQPGFRPYLYDFIYDGTNTSPSWSHITVDSMSTEGMGPLTTDRGYQSNPWDVDPAQTNRKIKVDARLQMSRTPDGKYIVYTWTESDTTFTTGQLKWNSLPNIKARVLNASTGVLNPLEINVTGTANSDISSHAMFHFVSPKCQFVSDLNEEPIKGPILNVPITISNSTPYQQLSTNVHWYRCAALGFTVSTVGIDEHGSNILAQNSVVYPNPATNNATLGINLTSNSKVELQVLNTMGQLVKSSKADGQMGSNTIQVDLSGLASGIYMLNVKVGNASTTKKLVVE